MEVLEDDFAFLQRKGVEMKAVYEEWDSKSVKELEPSADIRMIRHLLTRE